MPPTIIGTPTENISRVAICQATGYRYAIRTAYDPVELISLAVYNLAGELVAASDNNDDIYTDMSFPRPFCVLDNGKIVTSTRSTLNIYNADFSLINSIAAPENYLFGDVAANGNSVYTLADDSTLGKVTKLYSIDCSAGSLPGALPTPVTLIEPEPEYMGGQAQSISVGADGNLYATNTFWIMKITPAGVMTIIPFDSQVWGSADPYAIAALGTKLYIVAMNVSTTQIFSMNMDGTSQELFFNDTTPYSWGEFIAASSTDLIFANNAWYDNISAYAASLFAFVGLVANGPVDFEITPTFASGALNVAFTEASGATQYSIHVNSKPVKLIDDGTTFNANVPTKKGSKSLAKIIAKDASGNVVDTTTILLDAIAAPILGCRLLSQTADTATLKWARLSNSVEALTGIRVYVKNMGTSVETSTVYAMEDLPTDKTVVVTGLTASVLYNIKIRAYNTLGESEDSAIVVVQM